MFVAFKLEDGLVIDRRGNPEPGHLPSSYPYVARAFAEKPLRLNEIFEGDVYTHFLIVQQGQVRVEVDGYIDPIDGVPVPPETVYLGKLEFASFNRGFTATPVEGSVTTGLVISRQGEARAYPRSKVGPLEASGRLRYIDGCSDSLIFCPPKKGEPALNHLHIPVEIHQTPHFHPSDRIGVIARGAGVCYEHPKATEHVIKTGDMINVDLSNKIEVPLSPGMGWLIEEGTVHSFHTHERKPGEVALDVIAFHPETNWGPDDESHPMLDYTLVGQGKAVRGANSDDDYQSGGHSKSVSAPKIVAKPGDGASVEVPQARS